MNADPITEKALAVAARYVRAAHVRAINVYADRLEGVAAQYRAAASHANREQATDAFLQLIEMTGRVTLNQIAAAGDLLAPLTAARQTQPETNQPDM